MKAIRFKIISIARNTRDTYTYVLKPVDDLYVPYEAGQFITLLLDINGRELRRSYSFSSTPGIDEYMSITIREVVNGEVSRYLLKNLDIGSEIRALPPAGKFVLNTFPENQRTIFFIAAGSGITPIYSIIKKLLQTEPLSNIILINQNRNKATTIFYNELTALENEFPKQMKNIFLFSNPGNAEPQRLQQELLEWLVNGNIGHKKHDTLFYTCGPQAFMRMVEFTLRSMRFEYEQIRKEFFQADSNIKPSFIMDETPHEALIHFNGNTFSIPVAYPKTILQSALERSIQLPYSCRGGRCSSCVAKCVKGSVKMIINEVLTDRELQEGLILTCVAFAETDVELKFEE